MPHFATYESGRSYEQGYPYPRSGGQAPLPSTFYPHIHPWNRRIPCHGSRPPPRHFKKRRSPPGAGETLPIIPRKCRRSTPRSAPNVSPRINGRDSDARPARLRPRRNGAPPPPRRGSNGRRNVGTRRHVCPVRNTPSHPRWGRSDPPRR